MSDYVVLAVSAMLISNVLLFALGHRVKWRAPFASFALTIAVALLGWAVEAALTNDAEPVAGVILVGSMIALAVVRVFPTWNAPGHAAFAATSVAAALFLTYSGYLLLTANFGLVAQALVSLLLVLQTATLTLLLGTLFETIDVVCRTRWRGVGGVKIACTQAPKVSVHVPIHAEPPELVMQTLDALSRLDYENYEVIVIDNNTADEALWKPVQAHCERLGSRFRFYHLLPWPGYKSGALNFALGETAEDAELIAVVDADYVVERHFLKALTGHFADPSVAFVQTPQDYRDGTSRGRCGQALYRAYMYFFAVSMLSRNETNSIIYAGTMGLIRKRALTEVGGWSEWCITEDAELSLRLLAAGYESVYVDETFGRGLMPMDLAGLKKQRYRWAFGGMQLLRIHFKTLVNPFSKLTAAQRLSYLNGGFQWLNDLLAIGYTGFLLLGAALLVTGLPLLDASALEVLLIASPVFLLLSVLRFFWAFRVQSRCSVREAVDAASVLLGLTWVVALACLRGLFSKEGVFLRTPKAAEKPTLADLLTVVRVEAVLAILCLFGSAAVLVAGNATGSIVQGITVGLLLWQAVPFLAAMRLNWWFSQESNADPAPLAVAVPVCSAQAEPSKLPFQRRKPPLLALLEVSRCSGNSGGTDGTPPCSFPNGLREQPE